MYPHAQNVQTRPAAVAFINTATPNVERPSINVESNHNSGINRTNERTASQPSTVSTGASSSSAHASTEPVTPARPPSPGSFFPCPPPYREIDPEAPPVYTVTDGRMYSFRFSGDVMSPPGGDAYPLPPRSPRGLSPPPDLGDAPPSYEEAASTAV